MLTFSVKRMAAVRTVDGDFSSAFWNTYHLCTFWTKIIVVLLICKIVFEYFITSFYSGKTIQIESVFSVAFTMVFRQGSVQFIEGKYIHKDIQKRTLFSEEKAQNTQCYTEP